MSWPLVPVSDLCDFVIDCVNKTAPVVPYETPYKMIRTTNVKGGFIDIKNVRYVTKDTFERWTRRCRPEYGDVVLTREAPVGEVGRCTFDSSENIFLGQRLFQYRPDPGKLDWNFLAYVLQSPDVQGRLHGRSFGATVAHVKVGDAETLLIPCPDIEEQRGIGGILAAYDDLIATNQRRIALLEEAARRLYREWFVYLRFPGHDSVKVVGGVPEGWQRGPVGGLFQRYIGGGWGKEQNDGSATELAYVIRGTDIPKLRRGAVADVPLRFHSSKNLASRRIQPGDLIFEASGGSRAQGVGRLLPVTELLLEQFDQSVMCASFCKLIRPIAGSSEYVTLLLDDLRETDALRIFENPSASNIINFAFEDFCVRQVSLFPDQNVLQSFRVAVHPVWAQIAVMGRQQVQLAKARDALLPKLMSGQLDISDISLPEAVEA